MSRQIKEQRVEAKIVTTFADNTTEEQDISGRVAELILVHEVKGSALVMAQSAMAQAKTVDKLLERFDDLATRISVSLASVVSQFNPGYVTKTPKVADDAPPFAPTE